MITSEAEHERRRTAYRKGLTDPELAAALGLSYTAVVYWRKSVGLARHKKKGQPPPWTEDEKKILRILARDCSKDDLASVMGRSKRSVEQKAFRMRIKIKRQKPRNISVGPRPKSEYRREITADERYKIALLHGLVKKGRGMVPDATTTDVLNAAIEAIRIGYGKSFISITEL